MARRRSEGEDVNEDRLVLPLDPLDALRGLLPVDPDAAPADEPSPRSNLWEENGEWLIECLVCEAWVVTTATRRDAELKFGRHSQNDHNDDEAPSG